MPRKVKELETNAPEELVEKKVLKPKTTKNSKTIVEPVVETDDKSKDLEKVVKSKKVKVEKKSSEPETVVIKSSEPEPVVKKPKGKKTTTKVESVETPEPIKQVTEEKVVKSTPSSEKKDIDTNNEEFNKLKNKWLDLLKKIEEMTIIMNNYEEEKNLLVSEMHKIIEKSQPKVDNLIEQNSKNLNNKNTISSKLLENDSSDSDSSDSDSDESDKEPIKKKTLQPKKLLVESSESDSDSD
jgi:hypothetical protein